ncbi:MAG: HEPN domain-containing protein [Rhodanobacter sp.]
MHPDIYLNDFATRSFRDTADEDYIMARAAYRAELDAQFLWSGLQAIEKYIKAILLYNRIAQPQKHGMRLGHDLERGLKELEKLPFKVKLSETSHDIIKHLDTYGRFRYLDTPYHIHGDELIKLDRAVWEIRLYCRVLNYKIKVGDEIVEMLPHHLATIEHAMKNPKPVREFTGVIETILSKKDHPARPALVWKNLFFNRHRRNTIKWRSRMHSVNSPLSLRPELLEEVRKFVWLPGEVVQAYEEELRQRRSG